MAEKGRRHYLTASAIHPWITEMLKKGYGKFPPPSKKAAE